MILLGVVLTSIGMVMLSRINSLLAFYLIFILMVTAGRSLSSMIAIDTTVANWFIRRRGSAFGLLRSAVAVGAAGVIVVAWFIDMYGWRTAFVATGIGTLLVGVPTALVMRHRPEQYGMLPDGETRETERGQPLDIRGGSEEATDVAEPEAEKEPDIGMTVMEALKTKPFWALSFGFSIRLLVTGAATLHAIPLVEDLGYSRATAAAVLGSMGMVSIIGRLGGGFLNDALGTKIVAVASVCSPRCLLPCHRLRPEPLAHNSVCGPVRPILRLLRGHYAGHQGRLLRSKVIRHHPGPLRDGADGRVHARPSLRRVRVRRLWQLSTSVSQLCGAARDLGCAIRLPATSPVQVNLASASLQW